MFRMLTHDQARGTKLALSISSSRGFDHPAWANAATRPHGSADAPLSPLENVTRGNGEGERPCCGVLTVVAAGVALLLAVQARMVRQAPLLVGAVGARI